MAKPSPGPNANTDSVCRKCPLYPLRPPEVYGLVTSATETAPTKLAKLDQQYIKTLPSCLSVISLPLALAIYNNPASLLSCI